MDNGITTTVETAHHKGDSIALSDQEASSITAAGNKTQSTGHFDVDDAWKYLNEHHKNGSVENVDMGKLRRKIDFHIVPLMFLCYFLQFLDKVILNYAAVMGLIPDLKLKKNDFANLATFTFVGFLCFEIVNIYLLQRVPAAKWLGFCVTMWGVATACGAAAINYQSMLVCRVFLGIFEATIGPSLLLISAQYYTKSEQAPRFALWYCGLGLGQIIGGLVSYGFQGLKTSLASWRIMFLVLGLFTVLIGICTFLLIPDTPMKARWMKDIEKTALLKHISTNNTGVNQTHFKPRQIIGALCDPQVYLLVLATLLIGLSSGVITTFSATLIKNIGYKPREAALRNIPSGVVSIFFTLLVGYGVRFGSHRWVWVIVCLVPAIIGAALMSFLPIKNKHGILAGIYLVNACVAPLAIFYAYVAANVAGATKRAFTAAVVSGAFSLANIISPQTFQNKDAPHYLPAKITVLATQAACAAVTVLLFLYYLHMNKKRRNMSSTREDEYLNPDVWAELTDKENSRFKYSY